MGKMLRLYEFTVLRFYRLWLHNLTNLPFYGFTVSGSSRSTTLIHDAFTNLPFYLVHTSITVLRFYGFTTFSCRFASLSFRTLTMMFTHAALLQHNLLYRNGIHLSAQSLIVRFVRLLQRGDFWRHYAHAQFYSDDIGYPRRGRLSPFKQEIETEEVT